jgi:hypothetical protein
MWFSLLLAVGWLVRQVFTPGKDSLLVLQEGIHPGKSGLLVLSISIVAVGLLSWWGLDLLFWRKYFPTQIPPKSPVKPGKKSNDNEERPGYRR